MNIEVKGLTWGGYDERGGSLKRHTVKSTWVA